ncbi:MAG TPA: type VI secretion system-associated protein TagF [Vicinamibacterales bacterium]
MEVGFYGKLPSHGDFLRRRVSDAFVGVWDPWLQDCVSASREALGDEWLDVYLTSPAWRFGCAAGICGPAPVVGLMVPSVDRVGRYFPLTLVAELHNGASVVAAASQAAAFFDAAERLVIETLAAEHVDVDTFDDHLMQLAEERGPFSLAPAVVLDPAAAAVLNDHVQACWQIPIGSLPQLAPALEELLSQRLSAVYDPLVLWWTAGSSIVEPSCLIAKGLPRPDTFAALLDGSWAERQWRSIPAQAGTNGAGTLASDVPPPQYRSAAATNVGKVRSINQDAFVERSEVGLWAVADGLGGESEGEIASRMVCDALADFTPEASFEDTIEGARERVRQVNELLDRAAARSVNGVRSGSTVVALLVRGRRCAVLWAGDSRLYRWRGGRLHQLTRDHNLAASEGATGREAHAVTRAVGGESTLTLDLHRDGVRPGDRFLLCSDGLTRTVPDGQIRAWLEHEDIGTAVDGLIKATLDAGAPDNVTVLIVEACA